MSLPITLYGATDCDDTQRTRDCLRRLGIGFTEINIDHDPEAERFVVFINYPHRSTPTLVIGAGKKKWILTEPKDEELVKILADANQWFLDV